MKTNPNDPVTPVTEWVNDKSSSTGFSHNVIPGLTKREYFALHLAAAYMSADYVGNSGVPAEQIAERGVDAADKLIAALNETSTSKQ